MGSQEKTPLESDEIIVSDEKSSPMVNTIPPLLETILEPNSDLSPVVSTRSRRPTLVKTNLSFLEEGHRKSTDSAIESAKKEKWTAKRVVKVTWAYVTTVKGFLIAVYMLNIVAWGGMLFLLLVNASPAMCHPTCNDLYSPRRIWIEIDAQILNALFCVTGIGLLPWRLRDGYLLFRGNWPKLSKIHAGWYIDGVTKRSLMWLVVILFLGNSVWQIALAVTMWSMNRFTRPPWVTGLCITVSFLCAIAAGALEWWEIRRRKKLQRAGKVAPPVDVVRRNSHGLDSITSGEQIV